YSLVPKATVFPILVFIGLEITAQSYHATPRRHYPALGIACLPALATLVLIFVEKVMYDPGLLASGANPAALSESVAGEVQILRVLANGFILTALLWASMLAAMIDGRMRRAGIFFLVCAACTAFGVIHSPLPGSPMYWPLQWQSGSLMPAGPFTGSTASLMLGVFWGYVAAGMMLIGYELFHPADPAHQLDAENSGGEP
ncbi:MAG: hypothetical protein KDB14_22405, partial [Planctomycetales bacterium]|nr:hypothetical protein [Planctomycetales bacterium]